MLMPARGRAGRHTLALLGSLCLFLSAVEYMIPKPLPFMRLGLANLPLLLALDLFNPADFALLALLKVLGQGVITGTLFSYVFLFALAGTFSSALVMYVMRHFWGKGRRGGITLAGIGCAGAMVSNGVQLYLARYLVFGTAIKYLAPPFLAAGFASGIALGLFCEIFCRRSRWYAKHIGLGAVDANNAPGAGGTECGAPGAMAAGLPVPHNTCRLQRRERWERFFSGGELCAAGLLMAMLFVFNPSTTSRVFQFAFFCVLAGVSGKKNNALLTVLVMAGIVFFNLLAPYGKVLAELGPVRVTQGSLLAGIKKAVTIEGLVMLSSACIQSDLRLPGKIGSLLAESFSLLGFLQANKRMVTRGNVLAGIDSLILQAEAQGENTATAAGDCAGLTKAESQQPRRRFAPALALLAMVLATAAAWLAR